MVRKILLTAFGLLVLSSAIAAPLFFLLPRAGAAGVGFQGSGVETYSGFSDNVRLGRIGDIQESDDVVMRVRVEGTFNNPSAIRWRGVALDTFNNQSWSKSDTGQEIDQKGNAE